jgi:hypothetical protein
LVFILGFASPGLAADFSGWDALLKKYVAPKITSGISLNAVDYKNLKADPEFQQVVEDLNPVALDKLTRKEEKLSFWINVYNILAVKMVADNYPVDSIKDVGNFFKPVWKRPAGMVAGKERTLNEIEHEILRAMGEPRIHVAIVCASVSCPDLRIEAFSPDRLDTQLDEQMKAFLANPGKGLRFDAKKNRVYISAIFDWFEGDFKAQGGVIEFISRYLDATVAKKIQGAKLSYLKYNWNVNDT